jgi:hypothetical protein
MSSVARWLDLFTNCLLVLIVSSSSISVSFLMRSWEFTYRCNTCWVRLHTRNSCFLRFTNYLRCDVFVEIQGHEIIHIRFDRPEPVAIFETLLYRRDGWNEVRL